MLKIRNLSSSRNRLGLALIAAALTASVVGCTAPAANDHALDTVATALQSSEAACGPAPDQVLITDPTGHPIPNTAPSTPSCAFNLHNAVNGESIVARASIDRSAPNDDLELALKRINDEAKRGNVDRSTIQRALDILEGNRIDGKSYSGFPLLNHNSGEKIKDVPPGGTVDITQLWWHETIQSDTAMLRFADPSQPFTIRYHVRTLKGGADDFAPVTMLNFGRGFDGSFFPLAEGVEHTFEVRMPPPAVFKGVYTWGWRIHPGRVQFVEQWSPDLEMAEAGVDIAAIGDRSPEKAIWNRLRTALASDSAANVAQLSAEALGSVDAMNRRSELPPNFTADPSADHTVVFANNEMYGNLRTANPTGPFTVHIVNADNFPHTYVMMKFFNRKQVFSSNDFGNFDMAPLTMQMVPPNSEINVNIDIGDTPAFLLYQFDPMHHDQAIYSLHTD